jgi:hypothetical protein
MNHARKAETARCQHVGSQLHMTLNFRSLILDVGVTQQKFCVLNIAEMRSGLVITCNVVRLLSFLRYNGLIMINNFVVVPRRLVSSCF